jgi:fatty acid CoA ligase FadD22
VAFITGDRRVTHGEVHEGAARTGSLLASAGVRRGDRVLIALPDGVEFVLAFLGAVRIGAVAVPVNPRLTEADHRAAAAGAAAVVCTTDLSGRFEGTVLAGEELDAGGYPPAPAVEVTDDDAAYAQFTSGTTGTPKEARHGHGHPPVYVEAFARPAIDIRRTDVLLSVSKLYFAYGLGNSLFFPLLTGCAAVLHAGHPRPDEIAGEIARQQVTVLFSVPTFYAHLVAGGRSAEMASVRVAVSAGEALGVELAARARAFLGCPILDGLGSTEVGQTFASNTLAECRDGTVGKALPPYRVDVRDGVLWVAGPTLPLGHAGDWLCTGDRAVLDEDGFLHLRGRVDDIEQVGGISVSPLEIEAVLSRHPAVTEVAVAGVVDVEGASRLEAFVVAVPGAAGFEDELVALARSELAPFKVPGAVHVVDALPRTPTGKLRRFALRQPNRSM